MKEHIDNMPIDKLVEKASKKDEIAFTTLIHMIEQEMYKIAKIKLKKDDDIYEAMQNSIILIYKNLRKLKNKKFFRTWSMRILINECLKILNKTKMNYDKYVEYDENIIIQDKDFDKIESKCDLEKLLYCLNENEKIILTLYYGEKFNMKEISNILSEPEGTIKSKISRAKIKIKKYIEEENLYEY